MLTFVSTPQSFLVTGHDSSEVLMLRTGPSQGEVKTYQIQKLPRGEEIAPKFPVSSKFIIKKGQLYFQNVFQMFPILSASIALIWATIISYPDNFSSLLACTLSFLQSILNTAAREVIFKHQSDIIYSCLKPCKGYAACLHTNRLLIMAYKVLH